MYPGTQRWPLTKKVWRQFDVFDLVMKRTQVNPACAARERSGIAIAEARNVCLACPMQERCHTLLDRNANPDEVQAICPNSGFFARHRLP
ncbi:DUF6455 family protein [Aquamicrobium segne]|uniref:DUF6455 family protein n=1 Tax=Aquamicrobium segne TaxID=469547 RepID=A0ABW0H4P2_9HYPH